MLDQNMITIIATVVTVIGTLGGTLGGVFLANRHSSKLEELRIEEEKVRERSKRNIMIVEELYSIILSIFEDIRTIVAIGISEKDLANEEVNRINRLDLLINLYLPTLVPLEKQYIESINMLARVYNNYCEVVSFMPDNTSSCYEAYESVLQRKETFVQNHNELRRELEKLVR